MTKGLRGNNKDIGELGKILKTQYFSFCIFFLLLKILTRINKKWSQISLFQRGYEKDPALVAKEAIREATQNKIDVVLVDTAGRMQVFVNSQNYPNTSFLFFLLN